MAGDTLWQKPEHFDALREAVDHKDAPAVQRLLDGGADVNMRDATGGTPLMWAAKGRSPEVARVLIDAGCNLHAKDDTGYDALKVAQYYGEWHMGALTTEADQIIAMIHDAESPLRKAVRWMIGRRL